MSYQYTVKLEIANKKERNNFDLTTITQHIQSAIDQYHNLETVRNKKRLSYQVTPTVLTLDIDSPVELNVPSKAIAKFTRLLLGLSRELSGIVSNGRVFQSIQTELEPSNIDNISTCETLKKVTEIFCEDTKDMAKTNGNLIMQRRIKELIFNVQ
jgi:hypothetical protein